MKTISRGDNKKYVIPNGSVEFNMYPVVNGVPMKSMAKGLRYLGSTTEVNLSIEKETKEHMSTECGFNTPDAEIVISSTVSGSLTVDNISSENLAMFFAGELEKATQTAKQNQTYVVKVYPALGYYLGKTKENPNGVFAATITKIETFANETNAKAGTSPVTTLAQGTDYEFNSEMAYLMIGDRTVTEKIDEEGTWIRVTYDTKKAMRDVVISGAKNIVGELIVRGCNAYGENRVFRLPMASLTASGDVALKGGEEFMTLSFDIKALKDEEEPSLYVNGQPTLNLP